MAYNLYLDDCRKPKISFGDTKHNNYLLDWVIVKSYDEFITYVTNNGVPDMVSFDHDLAHEHYEHQNVDLQAIYGTFKEMTGFHCAQWLIYYCIDNNLNLPEIVMIHSMSTVGAKNIKSLFTTYYKVNGITDYHKINDVEFDFINNRYVYIYYD